MYKKDINISKTRCLILAYAPFFGHIALAIPI